MAIVLVTGASRGLGLEFARQYAADGWHVLATCHTPARALALRDVGAKVAIHTLKLTQQDSGGFFRVGGSPAPW